MKPFTQELTNELYATRLLVFLEESPQSNKYRQVMLDTEHFKKVSNAIVEVIETNDEHDMEQVMIKESVELYTLPDLQEIYYEA